MQYTEILWLLEWQFLDENCDFFSFAQSIDCWYMLESPQKTVLTSTEQNNVYSPVNPIFSIQKWSMRSKLQGHVSMMHMITACSD